MKVSCRDCKHYAYVKNYHPSGEIIMSHTVYPNESEKYPNESENWCLQERLLAPTPIDASATVPADIRVKNKDNDCAQFEEYIVPPRKNTTGYVLTLKRPWWKFWS